MKYSFDLVLLDGSLYYEGGYETKDEAISKLKQISGGYCRNGRLVVGAIYEVSNRTLTVLSKYEIRSNAEDSKLIMELVKSK